jgi:rSAM/selenodomain-associated transferase 2
MRDDARMKIGVVIPTLNEAERLPLRIAELRAQPDVCHIVVVDGGSTDGTPERARELGVTVLLSAPGRGRQLALGAAEARGDVLLFLHADTVFSAGAAAAIVECLSRDSNAGGGNFRLRFDGGDAFSAWLDGFYAFIRRFGLYYGDSAIFVRRSVYDRIGGIRPLALMEDYDFVRRLSRAGPTANIQHPVLWTSARRFHGRKPAAIVWGWVKIHVLYWLGRSPDRLAVLYDSSRQRERRAGDTGGSSFKSQS